MGIPQVIDKYQVTRRLGGGRFGDVYHAFDRALQVEKAIKVLKESDPAAFLEKLKEAQVLAGCTHKHIVQINEANVFPVEGELRVVLDLEYVPEGSLEAAIEARWISVRSAVTAVRGALLGLEHAHSLGFLHRDIKPGNILLSPNCPKLSDFGLATKASPDGVGSAKGYCPHLPPEYYSTGETSELSDVYAAGITLFRALGNISDWKSVLGAIPNVLVCVQQGTLVKKIGYPPFVPTAIKRIVNKACSSDPRKRFATAAEFGQRLDALRFGIDWVRISESEWSGSKDGVTYCATIAENDKDLVVKKNGRKITKDCVRYPSYAEALGALNRHVAVSTLV